MKYYTLILTLSLLSLKLTATIFSEAKIVPWGVDCEIYSVKPVPYTINPEGRFAPKNNKKSEPGYTKHEKIEREKQKTSIAQKSCTAMIRFFQIYISPIDGPRSSFFPTSSQYALEAIRKHGVIKGIGMGCDRLMRENGEMWVYEVTDRFGTLRKLDPVH